MIDFPDFRHGELVKICPNCLQQWEDELGVCPEDGTELRRFDDQATRLEGKTLDERWLIEKKIGEGGMGEVYRGRQVSVDREIAVKVLRPAMASNEEYVNRFFREANLASNINHPNFITIYDFGQARNLHILYLAMELLQGVDLAARMKEGSLALDHILEIGTQICAALVAAHDANIVHRDLKPENVFLIDTPGGEIHLKVLDFGIAKELGNTSTVTKTGQIFGTPEYMSPEQCQGGGDIDGRSDLYSLGCILYELLTGVSPFHRDSIIQTLLAQVSDDFVPLRESGVSIPPTTMMIVEKLLRKMPEDRYENALVAREALQRELERIRENPAELENFLDSHRDTFEFDRLADSKTATRIYGEDKARRTAQLINLGTFGHLNADIRNAELEVEAPRSSRGRWLVAAFGVFVLVGILGAWDLGWMTGAPRSNPDAGFRAALLPVASGVVAAERAAAIDFAERESERLAMRVSILAAVSADWTSKAKRAPGPAVRDERQDSPSKPRVRDERQDPPPRPEMLNERTPLSIETRVRKLQDGLVRCYSERERLEDEGDVSIRFRINADGRVDQFSVTRSDFESAKMEACLENKISRWRFAPSRVGSGFTVHKRTLTFRIQ